MGTGPTRASSSAAKEISIRVKALIKYCIQDEASSQSQWELELFFFLIDFYLFDDKGQTICLIINSAFYNEYLIFEKNVFVAAVRFGKNHTFDFRSLIFYAKKCHFT